MADTKEAVDALRRLPFDLSSREDGRDWPIEVVTMVGMKRLNAWSPVAFPRSMIACPGISWKPEHGVGNVPY